MGGRFKCITAFNKNGYSHFKKVEQSQYSIQNYYFNLLGGIGAIAADLFFQFQNTEITFLFNNGIVERAQCLYF